MVGRERRGGRQRRAVRAVMESIKTNYADFDIA